MRTTVDLPDDVHKIVVNIARDTHRSVSATVADIVAREVRGGGAAGLVEDAERGVVLVDLGEPTTTENVRELEDDW